MDIKQIASHFSRQAHSYEQLAVMQKNIADLLLKLIPDKEYSTILDIGCGSGYLCRQLRKRFPAADITGVDIAPEMIRIAKKSDPDGNYICKDFMQMDLPKKKYDLLVSTSALHWTENIDPALKKYLSFGSMTAYAVFVKPSLESMHKAFKRAYKSAELPYREHIIRFPDIRQLPFVIKNIKYQQDYNSWREAFRAIKAIGGTYTFDDKRPYINRKVLAVLESLPGAQLEWRVAFAVSDTLTQK
jgi:malonyl-CoA O-methyltransferase